MEYTVKDLKCCDDMIGCEYCKNCGKWFNEKNDLAVKLHKGKRCQELLG